MKILIALALLSLAGLAGAADYVTSGTDYLWAWQYKDYSAMYGMSSPEGTNGVAEGAFASAAAQLKQPPGSARIANVSTRADGAHVYFEADGNPVGSIVIRQDGIVHPEIVAKLSSAGGDAAAGTSGISPATSAIAGETVMSILEKMDRVTRSANSMRANVSIQGSFLGQTMAQNGQLVFRAPDNFRLQMPEFVMNSTSGTSILYMPAANVYMELGKVGNFELAPGIGTPPEELSRQYAITLLEKRDIKGRPVFVLSLKPPTNGIGALLGSNAIKLFVDGQTWLPIRAEMDSVKFEYSNVRVNPGDVRDDEFVFRPPTGATRVSLGNLLTGIGGLQ